MRRAKARKNANESLRAIILVIFLAVVFSVLYYERLMLSAHMLQKIVVASLFQDSAEVQFETGAFFLNTRSANYDVKRAQEYLSKAAHLEPTYPYVHHELARVHFLNGNFDIAELHATIEIQNNGDATPQAYYVRGLIRGFKGEYDGAIKDYAKYLEFDVNNWAAINDYAWVLLKANRFEDAIIATARGLQMFPNNAWLLSTNSVALAEQGYKGPARAQAHAALLAAQHVTEEEWLTAYPGNDPRIARDGVQALQDATAINAQMLE